MLHISSVRIPISLDDIQRYVCYSYETQPAAGLLLDCQQLVFALSLSWEVIYRRFQTCFPQRTAVRTAVRRFSLLRCIVALLLRFSQAVSSWTTRS